eukprot:74428-Rhodomonas_salina.2
MEQPPGGLKAFRPAVIIVVIIALATAMSAAVFFQSGSEGISLTLAATSPESEPVDRRASTNSTVVATKKSKSKQVGLKASTNSTVGAKKAG